MLRRFFSIFALSAVLANVSFAEDLMQETGVPPKLAKPWQFGVDLGALVSWGFNQQFIGVVDGHFLNWGGKITGKANYVSGDHEWNNTLSWLEGFSKTPILPAIVKSADELRFLSEYLWKFGGWWGAFANFGLTTSVFHGQDLRASDFVYNLQDVSGAAVSSPFTGRAFPLTTPFQPLHLQQALGLFARPVDREDVRWDIRGGFEARETFAKNQRFVKASDATTVTVGTLSSFFQIGPMLGTQVTGELMEKKLSYRAGANAMYVVWRHSEKVLANTFALRMNFEAFAGLSLKIVEWASLAWDFRVLRIPDISEEFQLQNNVLLTFSYVF